MFVHTALFAAQLIPGYAIFRGFSVLEAEAWEGKPYVTVGDIFDPDRDFVYVLLMMVIDGFVFWLLVIIAEYAEPKVRPGGYRAGRDGTGRRTALRVTCSCPLRPQTPMPTDVQPRSPPAFVAAAAAAAAAAAVVPLLQISKCTAAMRQGSKHAPPEKLPREPDSQVKDEAKMVAEGTAKAALQIQNMNKKFITNDGRINHAVKDMSLGVPKGG